MFVCIVCIVFIVIVVLTVLFVLQLPTRVFPRELDVALAFFVILHLTLLALFLLLLLLLPIALRVLPYPVLFQELARGVQNPVAWSFAPARAAPDAPKQKLARVPDFALGTTKR